MACSVRPERGLTEPRTINFVAAEPQPRRQTPAQLQIRVNAGTLMLVNTGQYPPISQRRMGGLLVGIVAQGFCVGECNGQRHE
ncbi:hypothetical protein BaRGS_00034474 [Batillaria attramentaria]|uniref:Uncharacterized protein n=1 Tax=Batillaria attramentaria TaxID=370345 RepID=A0ABD0JH99_9CAEN